MAKTKIKKQPKKKLPVVAEKPPELPPATRFSDDPLPKQDKWVNRQRVLVFSSRGINHRHRHLMEDIKRLMPHHKPESKMERNKNLFVVNEMCEMKNCNKAMMFEGRKKKDLYVWCSNVPNGPSVKFLVENCKPPYDVLYTMGELKFTGNCLTGSRPLLSFDKSFSDAPHLQLFKELLTQTFGVPKHHPKSQPFIDHVYSFTYLDNRIWFRNYQILTEDGALAEVGPRFVLNPVKIFSGSFGGATLWENPDYISPSKYRQSLTKKAAHRYENKIQQKAEYEASRPETAYPEIDDFDIFKGDDPMEKAKEEIENDIKKEKAAEEEKQKAEHIKTIKIKRKKPKTLKKPVASKPKKGTQGENKSKKSKTDDNQPKKEFSIKRKQFKAKNKVGKKGEAKKGKRPKFRKS